MIDYIINFDWVQYWGFCSLQAIDPEYKLKPSPAGNKIFASIYEVYNKETQIATIQAHPRSSVMSPLMVVVKIENFVLYGPQMWHVIGRLNAGINLTLKGWTRIDVAADFTRLNDGRKPEALIADLFNGILHRRSARYEVFYGQDCRKIESLYKTKHGGLVAYLDKEVHKEANRITGYRCGSRASACCVYLYNKTIELQQKTYKPYISRQWQAAKFEGDVWRLEFSMKGKAIKTPFETFRTMPIVALFQTLVEQYFTIIDDSGRPIVIFSNAGAAIEKKKAEKAEGDRSARLYIARTLRVMREEQERDNLVIYDALRVAIREYANVKGLAPYLERKAKMLQLYDVLC